jgi:hypothetical protein
MVPVGLASVRRSSSIWMPTTKMIAGRVGVRGEDEEDGQGAARGLEVREASTYQLKSSDSVTRRCGVSNGS